MIISVGTNFFYTVTLPVTLWFLDRGKRYTDQADQVLFIDARDIYNQIDRAHRDWTPQQIEFLANIVRLWRGDEPEFDADSETLLNDNFPEDSYADVAGLCAVATQEQIEDQDWSLNPGRYVGLASHGVDDSEFFATMELLEEQFATLSAEAIALSDSVQANIEKVLRA